MAWVGVLRKGREMLVKRQGILHGLESLHLGVYMYMYIGFVQILEKSGEFWNSCSLKPYK